MAKTWQLSPAVGGRASGLRLLESSDRRVGNGSTRCLSKSWPNALVTVTQHFSSVDVGSPGRIDDLSLPLLPYCVKFHC